MKTIDADAVEKAVAAAEATTSAEIIVAINRRSGSYLDRNVIAATMAGLLAAGFMVVAPWWEFHPVWFLPDAVAIGVLSFLAVLLVRPLARAIAGRRRMEAQATLYARNAFHLLSVSGTRERTGLLVYVTLFEDRALLLADFGIEGKIPPARWLELAARAGSPSAADDPTTWLCGLIASCGAMLAEKLPPGDSNPDELPNRPCLEVL
ncbi:MAG: hypothetical protein HUU15_14910 [Candidatus Brocadiae bacterium]|nr:hypothetical protein [Candidatus Brocadiia bacterium]